MSYDPERPSLATQLHDKEMGERMNSNADQQFMIQYGDELDRIRAARDKGLLQQPYGFDMHDAANSNVKYRWKQQGIWDEHWTDDNDPSMIWKHEPRGDIPPGWRRPVKYETMTKQQADLDAQQQEVIRGAVDFQNRQMSRPCYQFVYQFVQERDWIRIGLSEQDQDHPANIDTRAYENTKSRWIRHGLWDDEWTHIPGTTWRHERASKFPSRFEEVNQRDAQHAAWRENADRPPRWYFMSPSLATYYRVPLPMSNDSSSPSVSPSPKIQSPMSRSPQHATAEAMAQIKIDDHDVAKSGRKRKRTSADKEEEKRPRITASRPPRRAAASKAMKNLAEAKRL